MSPNSFLGHGDMSVQAADAYYVDMSSKPQKWAPAENYLPQRQITLSLLKRQFSEIFIAFYM